MIVCQNIHNNQYFVLIEVTHYGKAIFVTPDAKVKELEIRLFTNFTDEDIELLISQNIINRNILASYNEHMTYLAAQNVIHSHEHSQNQSKTQNGRKITLSEIRKILKQIKDEKTPDQYNEILRNLYQLLGLNDIYGTSES